MQLHPGLVTDSCAYELSKAKWGAMEPSEIATHSIQLCRDSLLNSLSPGGVGEGDRTGEREGQGRETGRVRGRGTGQMRGRCREGEGLERGTGQKDRTKEVRIGCRCEDQ